MAAIEFSRFVRMAGRALLWLVAALLLLIAAWVLSNLRDIDPVPRPAALALPAPQLAEENNAYFALVGMRAQADREAAVVGRALWRLRRSAPVAPLSLPDRQAFAAQQRAEREALGESLAPPKALPCDASLPDCIGAWIAQADALGAQRQAQAVFGRRCEQLLDEHFEFEELLPATLHGAETGAAHASTANQCSQWLLSGAVLEWTRHRPAQAVALLVQADRLNRALLAGGRSLIGQMIALRATRHTLNAITSLALRDPAMATALAPLLAPWPDSVQAVRRWMVTEAAYGRNMLSLALRECYSVVDVVADDSVSWLEGAKGGLDSFMCRHQIGWHPERTLVANDELWLKRIAALDAGLPAAIESAAADSKVAESEGILGLLSWRNTMGNIVVAIGRHGSDSYVARQADIELHREAAVLALQAAPIAPMERAAWMARQEQSPIAKGRLSWDAAGQTLTARTWQQEYAGPSAFNAERDAIRIAWPKP